MPIGISTTCLYNLVPNQMNIGCPTKRSAHHKFFDKTMHDVFFNFFQSKKCVSVDACKVMRAFSIKGSFNKIN